VEWGVNNSRKTIHFEGYKGDTDIYFYYPGNYSTNDPVVATTLAAVTGACPRYRGIESPFAEIWEFLDGCIVTYDTDSKQNKLYTSLECPYSDTISDSDYRGDVSNSGGFGKKLLMGSRADFFPVTTGGSSSTYTCDSLWVNTSAELRLLVSGGRAVYGSSCGLGCLDAYRGLSYSHAVIGGRLFFLSVGA